MKALSLKQPWAELVVQGKKTIELRKWNTHFRGEFLIHASQSVDQQSMEKFALQALPHGCIVGKARLVAVKKYSSSEALHADSDKHLASGDWGNYGFVLEDAEKFAKPIPWKGALHFWEYDEKV